MICAFSGTLFGFVYTFQQLFISQKVVRSPSLSSFGERRHQSRWFSCPNLAEARFTVLSNTPTPLPTNPLKLLSGSCLLVSPQRPGASLLQRASPISTLARVRPRWFVLLALAARYATLSKSDFNDVAAGREQAQRCLVFMRRTSYGSIPSHPERPPKLTAARQ